MKGNFDASLDVVLKLEGGYVNNPEDKGGPTNLGVTQATWQHWCGRSRVVTTADIEHLTEADVTPLYQQVFWRGCSGDWLPKGVDLATFDWCVNSGVRRGNIGLQQALGVKQDGLVGPVTLNTASAANSTDLIDKVCDARAEFYRELDQPEFLQGWLRRVEEIRSAAKAMVEAPVEIH